MPDIDPAALSRPSITLSTTPIISTKSITVSAAASQKPVKISYNIAPRIELEPIYTALKLSIPADQWATYKEATGEFIIGRLNQAEYSNKVDAILFSYNGEREHLHNQLLAAIYGNLTREMPDQGLAPWVSTNDKPSAAPGSKPVSGDAAERRLKGEVMQLPPKDRRRIKDLIHNDYDPYDAMSGLLSDHHRSRVPRGMDVPASAVGSISGMNVDLEIKKRFNQPLAVESGEFPDMGCIEARMLPFCYEAGLPSGHMADVAQFMAAATETFIKEVLAGVFSRTRSNGPGDSGSAGFGMGAGWIQTHRYRRQLAHEEEAVARGELQRDKSGLLPIEFKVASDRGPLGMADLRIAMEMADCGMSSFPIINRSVLYSFREGELEEWDDYTYLDGFPPLPQKQQRLLMPPPPPGAVVVGGGGGVVDVEMSGVNGVREAQVPHANGDVMDVDVADMAWDGAEQDNFMALDGLLDGCLSMG